MQSCAAFKPYYTPLWHLYHPMQRPSEAKLCLILRKYRPPQRRLYHSLVSHHLQSILMNCLSHNVLTLHHT